MLSILLLSLVGLGLVALLVGHWAQALGWTHSEKISSEREKLRSLMRSSQKSELSGNPYRSLYVNVEPLNVESGVPVTVSSKALNTESMSWLFQSHFNLSSQDTRLLLRLLNTQPLTPSLQRVWIKLCAEHLTRKYETSHGTQKWLEQRLKQHYHAIRQVQLGGKSQAEGETGAAKTED